MNGCESTAARTERVVLQGTNITAGTYQVRLVGKACGTGTPAQITTVLTVTTDSGPKCQSVFVSVPVGVYYRYASERLSLVWRRWLAQVVIKRYFF